MGHYSARATATTATMETQACEPVSNAIPPVKPVMGLTLTTA